MKKAPPPLAITRARRMRREPTQAEAAMWLLLRTHFSEWRFRRQVPLAHAICDFASHRARLVIEIDGGQHGGAADVARDLGDVLGEVALQPYAPPSSANSPPSNFG